jgi:hypothetical protein
MDAIEFTARYKLYIDEIRSMIRPDLLSIIEQLKDINPHDLVMPSAWLQSKNEARGYVCSLLLLRARKYLKT